MNESDTEYGCDYKIKDLYIPDNESVSRILMEFNLHAGTTSEGEGVVEIGTIGEYDSILVVADIKDAQGINTIGRKTGEYFFGCRFRFKNDFVQVFQIKSLNSLNRYRLDIRRVEGGASLNVEPMPVPIP